MPEFDLAQMTKSLMPALSPSKTEFIGKYLDKNYYAKSSKLSERFNVACASFSLNLGRVNTIVGQLRQAARQPEDMQKVQEFSSRTAVVLKDLGKRCLTVKGALEQVEAADRALRPIATDAMKHANTLASQGRDLDLNSAIEGLRLTANLARNGHVDSFNEKVEELAAKLREVAPDEPFDPAPRQRFREAFALYGNEIMAVRSTDPEMTLEKAEETFDDITRRMAGTFQGQAQQLQLYGASAGFTTFVADAKVRAEINAALAKADEQLAVLDRWQAKERGDVRAEAKRIRGEMEKVFAREGVTDPGAVKALETAQQKLLTDAKALAVFAVNVVVAEAQLFGDKQAVVLQRLVALEGRGVTAGKAMSEKQRTPLLDALATARLAVMGLNGCNLDALAAASTLLDTAEAMVVDAENIKEINKLIQATIDEAQKTAKGMIKPVNPKSQAATTLDGELTEFDKVWKTKVVSEAKAEAEAFKTRATAMATENTAILEERKLIAKIIEEADRQLGLLNTAFKTMAAGTPAVGREYAGTLKSDIEGCRTWNNTRSELSFYPTIRQRLSATMVEIGRMLNNIEAVSRLSANEVLLQGLEAERLLREETERLRQEAEEKGGVPDVAALNKVREDYDAKMKLLTTRTDLIAESNAQAQAQEKDEALKEQFLTEAKAFAEEIKREQKAAGEKDAINAYDDEVQRHLERLETTRKLLKKGEGGPTGASAVSELDFVRRAMEGIRKRGAKTDPKVLGDIARQWEVEVDAFAKAAVQLMSRIEEFEKGKLEQPASKPINDVLTRVIGQMNAHGFAAPAGVLSNPAATDAERRNAREVVLAEVRRLKKAIFDDPMVQGCILNPFGVSLGSATQYRLEEIELNVLRGV